MSLTESTGFDSDCLNMENSLFVNMAKRITIMLDDDLVKKLHEIQAKKIKESSESVSFSAVLNNALEKGLKK